jgi:hypothetical protein
LDYKNIVIINYKQNNKKDNYKLLYQMDFKKIGIFIWCILAIIVGVIGLQLSIKW